MGKNASNRGKYQEISKANRNMFMWVAAASVVAGFSIVIGIFLLQKVIYASKVINAQESTESRLRQNIANIDTLKKNVRLLDTNQDLMTTRLKIDDRAIQSVLDALPADANATALASSLQKRLLDVPGVTIESLTVDSGLTDDQQVSDVSEVEEIGLSFVVSSSQSDVNSLREVLLRLERSIRSVHITSLKFDSQASKRVMSVSAKAYYQPPTGVDSKKVEVKP